MKKLLILICSSILAGGALAQQHTHTHEHPHNPFPKLPNEAVLLKGFNADSVKRVAIQKTSKPAEQLEYFEAAKRRYLATKMQAQGKSKIFYGGNPAGKEIPGGGPVNPMNANCPNAGFDYGDYTGWIGGTYTNSAASLWNSFVPAWTAGIMTAGTNTLAQAAWPGWATNPYPNRHTLLTIPPTLNAPPNCIGWDSIAINSVSGLSDIPFVPATANGVTCRLGNANNQWNETERLVYTLPVTAQNSQFTYAYALVIYDGGHAVGEQPFFKITVKDQAGNLIPGCGQYQIDATQVATDTSFHSVPNSWGIYYKKWTQVGMNLNAYIGQTVTMEFQTGDCIWGGHWAYAYIDAPNGGCQPAQATVNMCTGSTTATLVAPPGYTSYQWYGPNGMTLISGATNDSLLINNAVVGDVYTVSVITAAGCTTQMQTTLINTNVTIQSIFSSPSCASGNSGSATVIAVGSNAGYNYSWSTISGTPVGGNTSTVTGLSPGTYSVSVSAPGCGQADTTIQVMISPPVYYTQTQNFCGNPAQVPAPAGSNYIWYDNGGNLISGANTGTLTVINPMSGDDYTAVFDNPSGCRDSVKITLTQTVYTSTVNATFCGTSATQCAPTGATNVIWYDANWPYAQIGTGSCITINNPVTTSWSPYYYSFTNPTTGCKDSVMLYLTNIPATIYPTNLSGSCVGDSTGGVTLNISSGSATTFTLTVTGPVNYSNNSAGASTALTNQPAGSYTATFSDGQCTASTTYTINPMSVNVTAATAPTTICSGQQAVVSFTYGGGTPTTCQVATSGCGSTTTQTVGTGAIQNPTTSWPTPYGNWYANEKYQILYTASDLLAAGITAGKLTSIGWDVVSIPAGMNTTFLNYEIKIGCTSVTDLDPSNLGWSIPFVTAPMTTVWGPQTHVVNTGWSTHTFNNAYEWDGTSSILVEICYTWSTSGSFTSNAVVNNTNTPYRSFLVYNSDFTPACSQTTANSSYAQRPNTRFNTCQSISLPSDFTYSWNPSTGVSGTPPTVNLAPTTSTNYTLTITSNAGGCTKDTIIPITVINPFTITMPASPTYCFANPADTLSAITTPATPGTWTGTGVTDAGNGADCYFNPATAGIGTHYAVFTGGSNGCIASDSVLITVNTMADASISAAGPFCITDAPITINVLQPGGTFSGSGITNTTTGAFSPSVAGAGTATVSYVISGQCSDSSAISIVVYPQPDISITADTTEGCNPTNISFTSTVPAPANGNAQWFFGDGYTGNTQNMIHQYLDTGMYSVTFIYTDANGCSDTVTNTNMIWIHPSVTAAFTASPNQTTVIDGTVAFTNQSVGSNTYLWQLTEDTTSIEENPVYMYMEPGTYNVVLWASNQYGCVDTASNTVIVEPAVALYVPNAFTPGDENNLNDVFLPFISGVDISTYRLEIYDRWGERIFQTEDTAEGWNGKRNNTGQLVQNGVYVYKIYYKNTDKKKVTYVGHVTVVK